MSWHLEPMLGLDFESTGVDPLTARVVTACLQLVGTGSGFTKTWLADAGGEDIPEAAARIHGVTTDIAHREGRPVADVVREIAATITEANDKGVPIVAFNASYEITLLNAELVRAGSEAVVPRYVIDPFVIDRAIDKYRKGKRNLTAACGHYKVTQGQAHTADGDVVSTLRLAWVLGARATLGTASPERRGVRLASLSLDDLMDAQGRWHKEWAEGFREHLTKQGKDASEVSGDWPMRLKVAA